MNNWEIYVCVIYGVVVLSVIWGFLGKKIKNKIIEFMKIKGIETEDILLYIALTALAVYAALIVFKIYLLRINGYIE